MDRGWCKFNLAVPIARSRRELCLSEHTIKKYLFRIFDKLGISSRVELVRYALSHGGSRQAEWVAGVGA